MYLTGCLYSADGVQPAWPWKVFRAGFGGTSDCNNNLCSLCPWLHSFGRNRYFNKNSTYRVMPSCCRKATAPLGCAHGRSGVKVPYNVLLPPHIWLPNLFLHDWIRDYCSFLPSFATNSSQCDPNQYQYYSVFNFEHLNCSGNFCKRNPEHFWTICCKWDSTECCPGSITCDKQKSAETSPNSFETKLGLSYRWQRFQSCLHCTCTLSGISRGYMRDF